MGAEDTETVEIEQGQGRRKTRKQWRGAREEEAEGKQAGVEDGEAGIEEWQESRARMMGSRKG